MLTRRTSMAAVALTASVVTLSLFTNAHAQAPMGPEGCREGFVFRDAIPGDRVCVEPATREQMRIENAAAESRKAETAFGQPGCADGFVFRALTPDDKVCVAPAIREQIAADNAQSEQRRGAPGTPGTPTPGMSPQLTQAIRQAFLTWARTNSLANASLVVMQNAQFANATSEGTWTADTIVPVASLSKAITGACIMTLIDSRRINFDSTLQVVAPNLTASLQPAFQFNAASVRIGHLLRHASGLSLQSTQATFSTGAAAANPALWFAQQSLNQTLASSPGTRYLYNNTNFAILELVIAEVTGESYETYCKRTVLTPRGAPNARIGAGIRAMGGWGGWEISTREYANFYAWSFDPRSLAFLSRAGHDFLTDTPASGFTINGCTGCNYGLGLIVVRTGAPARPLGPARNTFHHGDWTSSATTPTTFAAFAATWDNGFTVVVTYDRFISSAAQVDLDNQLRAAAYRRDL